MFPLLSWEQVRGPAFKWLSKVLQDIQEKLSNTIHRESFLDSPVKFNNANLSRQFGISKSILSHSISDFWQRAVWGWAGRSERDKKESAGTPWMPQWFYWKWSYRNGNAAIELIHTHTQKKKKSLNGLLWMFSWKENLKFHNFSPQALQSFKGKSKNLKKVDLPTSAPTHLVCHIIYLIHFYFWRCNDLLCPLFDSLRLFFSMRWITWHQILIWSLVIWEVFLRNTRTTCRNINGSKIKIHGHCCCFVFVGMNANWGKGLLAWAQDEVIWLVMIRRVSAVGNHFLTWLLV